jgi:hypothetical protein
VIIDADHASDRGTADASRDDIDQLPGLSQRCPIARVGPRETKDGYRPPGLTEIGTWRGGIPLSERGSFIVGPFCNELRNGEYKKFIFSQRRRNLEIFQRRYTFHVVEQQNHDVGPLAWEERRGGETRGDGILALYPERTRADCGGEKRVQRGRFISIRHCILGMLRLYLTF